MYNVLFTVSYLLDVEDDLLTDSLEAENFNNAVFNKLAKNNRKKIDETHAAKWNSSSFIVLDSQKMNCGNCKKCGAWTTDREKDNPIAGLTNGATVDGILFCDECLSKNHRWAF